MINIYNMKRSIFILSTIFFFTSTTFISCEKDKQDPSKVVIDSEKFVPSTITVKTGTTVTWVNDEGDMHTVTSNYGVFDSGDLTDGSSFSFTFSTPGEYYYHCKHYTTMTGCVIVE